jgi:hypothetical protein
LPSFPDRPEIIDRATIRIRSERKWPEKIVLDTDQPTFSPLSIEVAQAQQSVEPLPDEMTDQTSVDALATFRRKIGWRWLLDRIDWFAENCKIGRIWVDVGCDN